jgi:ribonucleotide reductase beta subunit family protein with ferritin-like domain
MSDPILFDEDPSYSLFPVKFEPLWRLYKLASDSYWTAEEIDFAGDVSAWEKLSVGERTLLSSTLAFFACSDAIVNENLCVNFMRDVAPQEAKCFYAFQMAMESVHSEVYSLLIDTYIKDPAKKAALFDAIHTVPVIAKKAAWAKRWLNSDAASFAQRLFAFAIFEGVYFQGSFATIYYMKHKGHVLPGLFFANALIARDEGLHTEFATALHGLLQPENRLDEGVAVQMIREAVELEIEFVTVALPCTMLGMSAASMSDYIKFVSDRLMMQMGFQPVFKVPNPLPWTTMIGLDSKVNFFEARNDQYSRANLHKNEISRPSAAAPGPAPADDDF